MKSQHFSVRSNHHSISVKHWLVVWNIFSFPYIGNVVIPTDELIFFRGVGQPGVLARQPPRLRCLTAITRVGSSPPTGLCHFRTALIFFLTATATKLAACLELSSLDSGCTSICYCWHRLLCWRLTFRSPSSSKTLGDCTPLYGSFAWLRIDIFDILHWFGYIWLG